MKWISLSSLSLVVFVMVACSPISSRGFIHTEGSRLMDSDNQEFYIRGVNLGNWLLPEGYMWYLKEENADRPRRIEARIEALLGPRKAERFWKEYRKSYITRKDIRMIADAGFNTVRLPVNYRNLMEDTDAIHFKRRGFRTLNRLIRWCRRSGLYIVIDLHAAPGGQTGRNIDDSAFDLPELFIKEKYRRQTIALWKEIARRYNRSSHVLAYDLLNEPLPADTAWMYHKDLEALYIDITRAIRTVDSRHIITIEGAHWANDWSVFSQPFDENLLYQFHKYWDDPTEDSLKPYLEFRDKYQVPIWCGETGENSNAWYARTISLFEEKNIGWAFWPWKKLDRANNPVSIPWPAGWNYLQGYMEYGDSLSEEQGEEILNSFLEGMDLENCTINEVVLKALFP